MSNEGYEIGWEDEIEKDSPDFVILPEGDYNFVVTEFERARHPGSEKLPPCNKAVVHIKIETPEGISTIKHNLFLHTITEGMLSAFFTGIGQKKKGERVTMHWNTVVGSTGRCKLGIRKWKTDDGEERSSNEIKRFYEPPEQSSSQQSFEPGRF